MANMMLLNCPWRKFAEYLLTPITLSTHSPKSWRTSKKTRLSARDRGLSVSLAQRAHPRLRTELLSSRASRCSSNSLGVSVLSPIFKETYRRIFSQLLLLLRRDGFSKCRFIGLVQVTAHFWRSQFRLYLPRHLRTSLSPKTFHLTEYHRRSWSVTVVAGP